MTVLTCLPESICSWNYKITFADSNATASAQFDFWNEQGSITLDSNDYRIQHAQLSDKWSLESNGRVVAVAIKPNPFGRLFKVSYGSQNLVLRAESPFTRSFRIEQNDRLLGTIRPKHSFTKRASIDCPSSITLPVQIFMFWLTVLMWKRAENNAATAGTAGWGG